MLWTLLQHHLLQMILTIYNDIKNTEQILLLTYSPHVHVTYETECLTSEADSCDRGGVLVQGLE